MQAGPPPRRCLITCHRHLPMQPHSLISMSAVSCFECNYQLQHQQHSHPSGWPRHIRRVGACCLARVASIGGLDDLRALGGLASHGCQPRERMSRYTCVPTLAALVSTPRLAPAKLRNVIRERGDEILGLARRGGRRAEDLSLLSSCVARTRAAR